MIVLVMVVPILAPITMGIVFSNVRDPEATAAITIEVVVEELCKIEVASNPINNPIIGFEVALMITAMMPSLK